MRSSESERQAAAALAITFDDRHMRRQLALHHPEALERARLALALVDRREARLKNVP